MVRRTQRLKGRQQPVAGDVGKNNHKLNLTTLSSRKYRGTASLHQEGEHVRDSVEWLQTEATEPW